MANDQNEKRKGLFSSIASVFVEQVTVDNKATPTPATTTTQTTTTRTVTSAPLASSTPVQLDNDILKQIYKVLDENNLDGYDYFEFRAAIENMKSVIPDETSRFKAAFAAVSSFTNAEKLTTTADFYIQKLTEHKNEFEKFSESMIQSKVVGKEAKAKSIEQTVSDKMAQIAKINEDIAKLQNEKMTLLTESATEKVKIDTIKMNYLTASAKIVEEINSDKSKISTYLTK